MMILILLLAVILLYLFMVAPRMIGRADRKPFMNRHYAHRGLFDNASEAPENSLAAIRKAVEAGYGIEFDIQLSKEVLAEVDGKVPLIIEYKLDRVQTRVCELADGILSN